jgi:hypothetical protein
MFDFYDASHKLQLFVHAVTLFDRYLSVKQVPLRMYVKVASACVYMTQYLYKRQVLASRVIVEASKKINKSLLHNNNIPEPNVTSRDLIDIVHDIFVCLNYDLYRITFDVLLARKGIPVDMTIVANVLINNVGPYENDVLLEKYVAMKY